MRYMIKQLMAIGLGVVAIFVLSSLKLPDFSGLSVRDLWSDDLCLDRRPGHWSAHPWRQELDVFGPLSIEPVEIARIGFIVAIAAVLDHPEKEMRPFHWMATVFAMGAVHMGLILREPYLGGTVVYVPIMLAMLYFAGIPPIYLFGGDLLRQRGRRNSLNLHLFLHAAAALKLHPLANFSRHRLRRNAFRH